MRLVLSVTCSGAQLCSLHVAQSADVLAVREAVLHSLTYHQVDKHKLAGSDLPCHLSAALGVVGMLRRLALWTEEDAWNGKLTILPRSIVAWLHNTSRYRCSVASMNNAT